MGVSGICGMKEGETGYWCIGLDEFFDFCGGKNCGDPCTLCLFGDENCVEF